MGLPRNLSGARNDIPFLLFRGLKRRGSIYSPALWYRRCHSEHSEESHILPKILVIEKNINTAPR